MIPTPHIDAKEQGDIAETILLPGDPLRARFIAENYLDGAVQFTSIRNMLGYTGHYQGKRISVMGTGMGMPSFGIYAYELIHFFGVKNLIRIGSCGAMQPDLQMKDLILAMASSTDSGFVRQYNLPGDFAPSASWKLLKKAADTAGQKGIAVRVGNVLSTDYFYNESSDDWKKWAAMGILAVDMETAALYMLAARAGVDALAILAVSDSLVSHEAMTALDRQTSFTQMIELALSLV